jgi:multidrug efflux pump subunit AcrA (membrane-fusion protein)
VKRALKILLPILVLSIGIGVFAALRATKPVQVAAKIEERVWRVQVMAVEPRRLSPVLTLYGRVETPSMFKAAAPASSRVDRVQVREGERVAKGQLLISLDERDFRPGLNRARAEVADLEAQMRSEAIRQESDLAALRHEKRLLTLARDGVNRAQRLQKQKLGSDSALDQAEQALAQQALSLSTRQLAITDHPARLKALEARLERARAGLAERELDFERSQVIAPFAGIVAQVQVAEGDQVTDNSMLLSMYDPASLEVRARIPAPFQDELQRAQQAGYPLHAESSISSGELKLRLARLAGEADPSGVDALFLVESGSEWLRTGQLLRFHLRLAPRDQSLPVPYAAVYEGNRIYKLEAGRMRGVKVETLGSYLDEQGKEQLLVRSPELAAGEELVITHLPNAIDGLPAEAVGGE